MLDIHDKKDGPHGLVAGTTGSGKSETLQTFILSIAMNYSPEDATFVLIDYKGGGMANVFEGLPHIAGMITNLSDAESGELDSGLTRRACDSLKSEVRRRQAVFKEYGVNHIDAYSRLYREGRTNIPMPHLIIISDEFAELKKNSLTLLKNWYQYQESDEASEFTLFLRPRSLRVLLMMKYRATQDSGSASVFRTSRTVQV